MNASQTIKTSSLKALNVQAAMAFPEIRELMQQKQIATDRCIEAALQSDITLISKLSEHIIHSGGKRLRPLVVLIGAAAFGYQGDADVELAAVIELIHTATLLHDDVVDGSELRRGKPTANVLWGNQASVLVGDFLYSRAFRMMVNVNNMRVMEVLANATNTIAAGEVLQLSHIKNPDTTQDRYMQVIRYKTGALFEAASQLGSILCQRPNSDVQLMAKYGMHLGTAFQLLDDVLDYSASTQQIGKNMGDDLAEGKPTLPLIYAMKNGTAAQVELLRSAIMQGTCDNIADVLEIIESTKAIAYTYQIAQEEAEKAIEMLTTIPESPYRAALFGLAKFVLARQS